MARSRRLSVNVLILADVMEAVQTHHRLICLLPYEHAVGYCSAMAQWALTAVSQRWLNESPLPWEKYSVERQLRPLAQCAQRPLPQIGLLPALLRGCHRPGHDPYILGQMGTTLAAQRTKPQRAALIAKKTNGSKPSRKAEVSA